MSTAHADAGSEVVQVAPNGPLRGEARVPGDKSISHRAVLFNALASGGSARVTGLSGGEDVTATIQACRALGCAIAAVPEGDGPGAGRTAVIRSTRLREPDDVIDCGNSGTSIRLLLGALAAGDDGAERFAVLTGDGSLRSRPMGRVVAPLRAMGARIDGRDHGRLAPLGIHARPLTAVDHDLPIASAQLKSALLLAGLRCGVAVREPHRSRDHTERMLRGMGAALADTDGDGWLRLAPSELASVDVHVPGDLSAAAFLLVAGAIVPGSELTLRDIGVNPTRTGVIDALIAMGADLTVHPAAASGPEPAADVVVRAGPLRGTTIDGELALRCLDELPVLAMAAAVAAGTTVIRDAAELRVKESDRIARVAVGLRTVGVDVEERPDGMIVHGLGRGPTRSGVVDATGDHRIAMAFAVLGRVTDGGISVHGAEAVRSSWPGFFALLAGLR